MSWSLILVALGAAGVLLAAGWLFGVRAGREARRGLRERLASDTLLLQRMRDRIAELKQGRQDEDSSLRDAVRDMRDVIGPLVQRERMAYDLAHLQAGVDGSAQRDLSALLDEIAERGNLLEVMLTDAQGLVLAASRGVTDHERLAATATRMRLTAERLGRDDAPAPRALLLYDGDNRSTLTRLFQVHAHALALTVVALGESPGPASFDPALVRIAAVLTRHDPVAASAEGAGDLGVTSA